MFFPPFCLPLSREHELEFEQHDKMYDFGQLFKWSKHQCFDTWTLDDFRTRIDDIQDMISDIDRSDLSPLTKRTIKRALREERKLLEKISGVYGLYP